MSLACAGSYCKDVWRDANPKMSIGSLLDLYWISTGSLLDLYWISIESGPESGAGSGSGSGTGPGYGSGS